MTKKREMAEWIMDFFRKSKLDVGQVVMMRTVQNKLYDLNPRERDLFVPVAQELIDNGYFTYEEGASQSLRLTQKGRDYIYDPNAELDCCQDNNLTPAQKQYIAAWHQNFTSYIEQLKTFIAGLMLIPEATIEDIRALEQCMQILNGSDVHDIEKSLGEEKISKAVLDKIEKFDKDLVDMAVDHLRTDVLVKEFWRSLAHIKIYQEKKAEEMRLNKLKIVPV